MLVSTLIERVREDYLDDTLGVDKDDSLVSGTSLVRFAEEAQIQACRRTDLLYDESTEEVCTFTLVANQRAYSLNKLIRRLVRVSHNGVDLCQVTEDMLGVNYPAWRATANGTPTHFYIRGTSIYLYPKPDADAVSAGTLDLAVYRQPIAAITDPTQEFEIPEEATGDLVYWMLYRVYSLRDEDLSDPTVAANYLALFERTYGDLVPIDVWVHQLESPAVLTHTSPDKYAFVGDTEDDPEFDNTGWS